MKYLDLVLSFLQRLSEKSWGEVSLMLSCEAHLSNETISKLEHFLKVQGIIKFFLIAIICF